MGLVWSMKPRGANGGRYLAPRDLAELRPSSFS